MTRALLAAAAVAAALPLGPASAAPAVGCTAVADVPHKAGVAIETSGTYACSGTRSGMTIRVCTEVPSATKTWTAIGCNTWSASHPTATISGWHRTCPGNAISIVRSAVTGWNANGETASAVSPPAVLNCTPVG